MWKGFNFRGMVKSALDKPASSFFSRYRDATLFNKNLIISGAAGFFASAIVSQLYSQYDSNDFVNSLLALVSEYAVYIPLFALLFYLDNRQKYVDLTGKRNTKQIREDIKKLFAAFSLSEVIFAITRVLAQYQLLQADIKPYEASMIGSLVAWGVFFVSINIMAKLVKLFRKT